MKHTTPIKACIFDNDGTLLDTEWAYEWSHEQLTGHKLDTALKAKLMGKSSKETCEMVVKMYNLNETPEEFGVRRTALLDTCWHDIKLLPGAEALCRKLHEMGIKMGVATASRNHVFARKISGNEEFYKLFDPIICGNEVSRGKPAPDIFLAAMGKWENIKPEECIVFEDSPLGIKAANRAGMPSVFIPDPRLNVQEVLAAEDALPTYIIPSLEKFDWNSFNWAV